MRAPLSWIREFVDLPADVTGRGLAEVLIRQGLEVETVHTVGAGTSGPLVVGRVTHIESLTGFKKPIRYCEVEVGSSFGASRNIVCGAENFAVGDSVVVALPGAILPGGFAISARETYGRTSEGMICSERELGLGDDGSGILVLPADAPAPGSDAMALLGIGEEVLDIAVTPDRGYALSIRGIAREAAIGFDCHFTDPADLAASGSHVLAAPTAALQPIECASLGPEACRLLTMRTLTGFDAAAPSPAWLRSRLSAAGMRPISVVVDVTNYVMLETGQPLHAFDADQLEGRLVARRAREGESLTTLDGVVRALDAADLVIADDSRPLALAGTMGGQFAQITAASKTLALEAANFDAVTVGRMARRHKLPTEASRRFERGVDPLVAPFASARAAALIMELAGGSHCGMTGWEAPLRNHEIEIGAGEPARLAGLELDTDTVVRQLVAVGCLVSRTVPAADGGSAHPAQEAMLAVMPPSWRPDLRQPADLVEEVLRLVGYDQIPATLPLVPAGHGLTREQRLRRRASRAAAGFGLTEVLAYPFIGLADLDRLGVEPDDQRRNLVALVNPLSDERPGLRTTMLPGLLATAARNISRGADRVTIFEIGSVFVNPPDRERPIAGRPDAAARPTPEQLAELVAGLPDQPRHVGAVLGGTWERPGWWGPGRDAAWPDAIEFARRLAGALGAKLLIAQAGDDAVGPAPAPWHPGRCAALFVVGATRIPEATALTADAGKVLVGYAGELHPRVAERYDLPARTAAAELDLDQLIGMANDVAIGPVVATMPLAKEDLAVVVAEPVPSAAVAAALRSGAGPLLESLRLFDVYRGAQVPDGHKSLAFSLRFRAADHTLAAEEVAAARAGALAEAAARTGAVLRG